tara:strand:- start:138904 stop:139548 length:645 start_codon:yes stop_codon:yes gene_type:complete
MFAQVFAQQRRQGDRQVLMSLPERIRKRPQMDTSRPKRSASFRRRDSRRGVVTLELIVVTPIIAIMLSAAVEFGVLLAGLEHVSASARAGAKVASELSTANLASAAPADNIDMVQAAIDNVLGSAGMASCMVILDHNPDCSGLIAATKSTGACAGCAAPVAALPGTGVIPGGSVRVTVCVDAATAAPNLLSTFGYDLTGRVISESITLPYENCP